VFLDKPYEARPEWDFVAGAPLLQMVCNDCTRVRPSENIQIVELGLPDSSEMLELTTLTKPGPFGRERMNWEIMSAFEMTGNLSPWRASA
jgi:hypothetical protein